MKHVLVTGANGFVGKRVCSRLRKEGYAVRGAVRHYAPCCDDDVRWSATLNGEIVSVGDIDENIDWSTALDGIDVVVHLAARVHVMQEISKDPLESFRSVNVHGTERLARMAIEKGVRRFVYISSISVHGNSTVARAYLEEDEAQPSSPYAVSKWEGELALRKIERESNLDVVIVRPPLVYGEGVGGNFLRMMQWVQKGLPLPLKSIRNKRSFIGIENLANLVACCVSHTKAAGETFLAADGEDLSTPDLVDCVAKFMGCSARLFSTPVSVIRAFGRITGKGDITDRLCSSLQVDAGKARSVLKWQPRISLDEGLARTVKWYMEQNENGGNCVL